MDLRDQIAWLERSRSGMSCSKTAVRRLASLVLVAAAACGSPPDRDPRDVGMVRITLDQIPADAACMEIVAEGSRTATKRFALLAGADASLELGGLPIGEVQFSGRTFQESCGTAMSVEPTWLSDPVLATIVKGVIAQIRLVMHRNGRVSISVDFRDDDGGVGDGAAGAGGAPHTDAGTGGAPGSGGNAGTIGDGGTAGAASGGAPGAGGAAGSGSGGGEAGDGGADAPGDAADAGPSCTAAGNSCASTTSCCAGTVCRFGSCWTCSADGLACDLSHPCCTGFDCLGGVCKVPACSAGGAMCDQSHPCCSGVTCSGNVCGGRCARNLEPCSGHQDCCFGGFCCGPQQICAVPSGTCMFTPCVPNGDSCQSPGVPCCGGGTCISGVCNAFCGAVTGAPCGGTRTCCPGDACIGGLCTRIVGCTLPGFPCGPGGSGCCSGFCNRVGALSECL